MLSQRTNLLLSPNEYHTLRNLIKSQGKTMGELIREAIHTTYNIPKTNTLETTLIRIRKLTKNIKTKDLNYRKLVTDGRKYD